MKDTLLYSKTLDYLKEFIPGFECRKTKIGKLMFTCPKCGKQGACTFTLQDTMEMLSCFECDGIIGDIVAMVRFCEKDKAEWSHEDIVHYLCKKYKIPTPSTEEDINKTLEFYASKGFDLVPIQANGKVPIEKEWTTKNHKTVAEWKEWLSRGANIGVKTGKCSNITILDLDTKIIPKELEPFLKDFKGLVQESSKGFHYFFQYESALPKTRIQKYLLDIENDGGQVVIFPSVVEGVSRKLSKFNDIPKMPQAIIDIILANTNTVPSPAEIVAKEFTGDEFKIPEGGRNSFLTSFGGALRKELGISETNYVINFINKYFCKPSLPRQEVDNIVRSLSKYVHQDTKGVASAILNYLKTVGEASARDCKEIVEEKKEVVDKILSQLVKDGFIMKKNRYFHFIKKADWKDTFFDGAKEIEFKIPFFSKYAILNYGDMVVLGARSKVGKTTIAMNFVKALVDQGVKPYYVSLETGSRFITSATKLGMKEGDFYWDFLSDPTKIEFEQNAVTILDWLLIEDKAQSDVVLKHFVEQLYKTKGFLIIFMQLKADNNWFAPNMIEQFPALAAKYIYDKDNDGTYGKWMIEAIREARYKMKKMSIPCVYDFDSRILSPMDEVQTDDTVNKEQI